MIVWGGLTAEVSSNTGGKYNPISDTWTNTNSLDAPSPRYEHSAVWTGIEMIIWGGATYNGKIYNPSLDSWRTLTNPSFPLGYFRHSAIWTGSSMIVWSSANYPNNTGGIYIPSGYLLFSNNAINTFLYLYRKN